MRRFVSPLALLLAILILWGPRAASAAITAAGTGGFETRPHAAAALFQQCASAFINAPRSGASLRGDVEILGSANADRFQFYKVEYAAATNPDGWAAVSSTIGRPVVNGRLDIWNTRTVPDGLYALKLTVVDDRAQEVCRAVVSQLQVANAGPRASATPPEPPSPTAEPTGSPTAQRTPTPQATVTPPVVPTLPPLPAGSGATTVALAQATPAPTGGPRATPGTPAATPRATATTSATRSGLSALIPDFSGIRRQFDSAFDMSRIRDAFLLGAIGTLAVFTFIGLVVLLRRLL